MKLAWNKWGYSLGQSVIGGVASALTAWIGTLAVGNGLDWKQAGSVLVVATVSNLVFFLKQSPLPKDEDEK